MKVLVTGASGFIGSFLVEKGLELGYDVWAGIRKGSSRRYLSDARINFVELDFSSSAALDASLSAFKADKGCWDYIIHAAGVTKCTDKKEFMKVNYEGTRNFADAIARQGMEPRMFVYISSLSVFGPVREEMPYTPIMESDTPMPDTVYGKSKLLAEEYLKKSAGFPFVILRPTGVYGPRERDYFKMVAGIKRHIDFSVGYRPQTITFIYVKDLVKAAYLAAESDANGRCYFVSEPAGYESRAFSDYIQKELGIKRVLHIKAPLWVLKTVSLVSGLFSKVTGKPSTLNSDKYRIMKQRNWLCDTGPLEKELGFAAEYPLDRGVRETMEWYKKEGWL